MRRRCLLVVGWVSAVFVMASIATACKLPVFRYALERWPADTYRVVALVDPSQMDTQRVDEIAKAWQQIKKWKVNAEFEWIDLSTLTEAQLWQTESYDGQAETPLLQIFYPPRNGKRRLCWSGELSQHALEDWMTSPFRQQLVGDLTSGVSAVWVLIEGTDAAANDRATEQLQVALKEATQTIAIPEGVIPADQASRYLQLHPEASMDDVLRSDIPLKIEFRLRRVKRESLSEQAFQTMVANWSEKTAEDQPLIVPVFGRGRMIDPLPASKLTHDVVLAACRYLVGECNCTVKAQNPGVDLLLVADWQQSVGNPITVNQSLGSREPELISIPTGTVVAKDLGRSGPTDRSFWIPLITAASLVVIVLIGRRVF